MKKFISIITGISLSTMLLTACVDEAPVEKEEPKVEQKAEKEKPVVKEKKKEPVVDKAKAALKIQADMENEQLLELQEGMAGVMVVTFDQETKTYEFTPLGETFIEEVVLVSQGLMDRGTWDDFVISTQMVSSQIQYKLGDGYYLTIVNPANTENILLMVSDGKVIYNFIEE